MDIKRGIKPELGLAFLFNIAVLSCLWFLPQSKPPPVPVEVSVDVVDYAAPEPPKAMAPPEIVELSEIQPVSEVMAASLLATPNLMTAVEKVSPDLKMPAVSPRSVSEVRSRVDDIMHEMRFFGQAPEDEAAEAKSGRPAGLRTGVSFDLRRDPGRREGALGRFGGDAASEGAVERSLAWLAGRQNADGSWGGAASFESGDAAALTSLALLTFLAHGENFTSEAYGKEVTAATDWLCEIAAMSDIEYVGGGFGHALLTYALAEAYAATGSLSIRNVLEKRLNVMIERQNKLGSYAPDYDNSPWSLPADPESDNPARREVELGEPLCDLSLLGWHLQALVAGRNAGILTERITPALNAAGRALFQVHQASDGGFSQGVNLRRYPSGGNMNPVGLLALSLLNARNSESARSARRLVEGSELPRWDTGQFPLYRWYYQTQAIFQTDGGSGRFWDAWNVNMKKELIPRQRGDGSWDAPPGERSFQLQDTEDLRIYTTAMCTLMLEVYYRYLPSYSMAESDNLKPLGDDEMDLAYSGLLSVMPEGADPMANLILGIGGARMAPVRFGVFNGIPPSPEEEQVYSEFNVFATLGSSVPVRNSGDWPQLLQPRQRIAIFCDDLLPENFKGHLGLTMGIASSGEFFDNSLEVTINGRRVYYSVLHGGRNLVEVLIPSLYLVDFGNVIQVRNTGEKPIAFDAACLDELADPGLELYLGAEGFEKLPPDFRSCFNLSVLTVDARLTADELKEAMLAARLAEVPVLLKVDAGLPERDFEWLLKEYAKASVFWEFTGKPEEAGTNEARQRKLAAAIPAARPLHSRRHDPHAEQADSMTLKMQEGEYAFGDESWSYLPAQGLERMGNHFLEHYMQLCGRQVASWVASGGSALYFTEITDGGRFFDPLLKTELPAALALRQCARLFDGKPRRLPAAAYPRYGDKPLWATAVAASCNAPGNATILVAQQYPLPTEIELTALVPWDGPTEVTVERGVIPQDSRFTGLGTPLQRKRQEVTVEGNTFRLSGVWPELAVLRLRRIGDAAVMPRKIDDRFRRAPLRIDKTSCRVFPGAAPAEGEVFPLRSGGGYAAASGTRASFQMIPATAGHPGGEAESTEVTLELNYGEKENSDSVYLAIGSGPDEPETLSFDVYPRAYPEMMAGQSVSVPIHFSLGGRSFQTLLTSGRWQTVRLALPKEPAFPYWDAVRILPPEISGATRFRRLSYEINGMAVLKTSTAEAESR